MCVQSTLGVPALVLPGAYAGGEAVEPLVASDGMIPEDLFTRIPYDSLLAPYLTLTTHLATRRLVPSSSALARRKTDGGTPPVSPSVVPPTVATSTTSRTASVTS